MTRLADLTTLQLGGPARRVITCTTDSDVIETVRDADTRGEPLLVLGGGSNLVVADDGFDGVVALVRTRGVTRAADAEGVTLEVAAGEPWDEMVTSCVDAGLAGFECLAGIPGSVGATPIQNVGAYGGEIAETVRSVHVYDRADQRVLTLPSEACGFAYRSSIFKRHPDRWVVLRVTFRLARDQLAAPVRYRELADALGVGLAERAPLRDVQAAVLRLRRGKGMVLDSNDPDTRSAGSFFLNPVLDAEHFSRLQAAVSRRCGPDSRPPAFPQPDGRVKTSAAWLIDRAGFRRGQGDPCGIAISTKHVLALTNRGNGTAAELLALAQQIALGVRQAFDVELYPEPRLIGLAWPDILPAAIE
jgi:UDP-N-acetylmuramate dehydrogenase